MKKYTEVEIDMEELREALERYFGFHVGIIKQIDVENRDGKSFLKVVSGYGDVANV